MVRDLLRKPHKSESLPPVPRLHALHQKQRHEHTTRKVNQKNQKTPKQASHTCRRQMSNTTLCNCFGPFIHQVPNHAPTTSHTFHPNLRGKERRSLQGEEDENQQDFHAIRTCVYTIAADTPCLHLLQKASRKRAWMIDNDREEHYEKIIHFT